MATHIALSFILLAALTMSGTALAGESQTSRTEVPKKSYDPSDPEQFLQLLKKLQAEGKVGFIIEPAEPPLSDESFKDEPLSAEQIEALKAQLAKCWTVSDGVQEVVEVDVYLNSDGSLARPPRVVDRARLSSSPNYRASAAAALRAIRLCQPFDLSAEEPLSPRILHLRFDPQQMIK